MFTTDEFSYEKSGAVATMTFNRPQVHNAISIELARGLGAAFEDFEADPVLRVAILTGAGEKAFCAGADLKTAIPHVTGHSGETGMDPGKRAFCDINKPVIAAVNGLALAGGAEYVFGTDIRIAAEHAIFGLPEVCLGLVPFGGSQVRLPQQIPFAVAMEIMLTGDPISAQRAYEIGLINKVVPAQDLMAEARRIAERICRNGPLSVQRIKQTVRATYNLPETAAFKLESEMALKVMASSDAKEGPRAFAEKRNPVFTGQ